MIWPSTLPRHQLIVRGPDGIDDVFAKLERGILAADCETTGLNWQVDRVGGLCFAAGQTAAFFCRDALGPAARWFADQVKRKRNLVFHGGKFDMHMIRETFGIHIAYPVHDTLTMSRLIDQRGAPLPKFPFFTWAHDLDKLADNLLGAQAGKDHQELIDAVRAKVGKRKSPAADWIAAPLRTSGKYGLRDPWYTLQLHSMFISAIAHWPQPNGYPSLMSLYKNERWLTLALRDMEERGVLLDREYLAEWIKKAERRVEKLTNKMNHRAGYDLNWRSNPQIKTLFWDELELEQVHGESTNKRALLRMNHPFAALLLKHRKQTKMVSSGKKLLTKSTIDGKLHCWFNQNVDTGRMSATDGMHQFAKDSGVRKGVIPPKGLVLRSADYSQVEMRYAAHFSGEETLIHGFRTDPKFDTHSALARRMFGIPKKQQPSDAQRSRGKTMNFAMLYGAGEDSVTEQLIDKISAEEARQSCIELGHTPGFNESPFRSLAQLLRDAVRESYPKMWRFTKNEEEIAKQFGFVVDAYGYHRWLDEDEAYKGMNSKVQGSAAHKAKEGVVNVYRDIQLGTGEIAMTMQVHDDVVYECEGDPKLDAWVLESLEDHTTFKVPITADMKGSAANWQDKETITLPKRRKIA